MYLTRDIEKNKNYLNLGNNKDIREVKEWLKEEAKKEEAKKEEKIEKLEKIYLTIEEAKDLFKTEDLQELTDKSVYFNTLVIIFKVVGQVELYDTEEPDPLKDPLNEMLFKKCKEIENQYIEKYRKE